MAASRSTRESKIFKLNPSTVIKTTGVQHSTESVTLFFREEIAATHALEKIKIALKSHAAKEFVDEYGGIPLEGLELAYVSSSGREEFSFWLTQAQYFVLESLSKKLMSHPVRIDTPLSTENKIGSSEKVYFNFSTEQEAQKILMNYRTVLRSGEALHLQQSLGDFVLEGLDEASVKLRGKEFSFWLTQEQNFILNSVKLIVDTRQDIRKLVSNSDRQQTLLKESKEFENYLNKIISRLTEKVEIKSKMAYEHGQKAEKSQVLLNQFTLDRLPESDTLYQNVNVEYNKHSQEYNRLFKIKKYYERTLVTLDEMLKSTRKLTTKISGLPSRRSCKWISKLYRKKIQKYQDRLISYCEGTRSLLNPLADMLKAPCQRELKELALTVGCSDSFRSIIMAIATPVSVSSMTQTLTTSPSVPTFPPPPYPDLKEEEAKLAEAVSALPLPPSTSLTTPTPSARTTVTL